MAVEADRISLNEKVLRGSKRDAEAPLMVVAAFGQQLGQVVAEGEDKTEAVMALFERVPLAGRLFTLDAGLMVEPVLEKVVGKGGPT